MTASLARSSRSTRGSEPVADLEADGIHRDPSAPDPIGSGTFAQRLVHRAAAALGGSRTTRRSFLTRTAVVGSALAVGPIDFLLKPGTAYGYVCGTCSDGWTAFCCTIMGGRNVCPPNSFVAGWWKADNAAYCCGAARYIIDCNATCPTQCTCRCAGGSCDGRRTCCNQFRYGQCHQEIACYGPVVCRVATCTPPWEYDPSCTTASATDNRTVNHGAPCLGTDCGSAIAKKYQALGGASGFLGATVTPEGPTGDGRGRRARYRGGNIYWTAKTGAFEVHGKILDEYGRQGATGGKLGYPTSDTRTASDKKSRFSNFEKGRIYEIIATGAVIAVPNPFFAKHESVGGVHGALRYPTAGVRASADKRSTYQSFAKGRIYSVDERVVEIHEPLFSAHEALRGVHGTYGYPTTDLLELGDGRGFSQWFEGGTAWYSSTTGPQFLSGAISDRYLAGGHAEGPLRYPTSSIAPVGDGRGTVATFEGGNIYATATTGAHEVRGTVLAYYLANGGPIGSLGYPTGELDPPGTGGGRYQSFEKGRLRYGAGGTVTPN